MRPPPLHPARGPPQTEFLLDLGGPDAEEPAPGFAQDGLDQTPKSILPSLSPCPRTTSTRAGTGSWKPTPGSPAPPEAYPPAIRQSGKPLLSGPDPLPRTFSSTNLDRSTNPTPPSKGSHRPEGPLKCLSFDGQETLQGGCSKAYAYLVTLGPGRREDARLHYIFWIFSCPLPG